MATKMKNKNVSETAELDIHEQDEARNLADDEAKAKTRSWLKKPDWELSIEKNVAVILGVSDEDLALLLSDDNQGFAKELVEWVTANNSSSIKVTKYRLQGSEYNIGTRGPGKEGPSNPFKARVPKASRNSGQKNVKLVQRDVTTQDVVAFILSGRLDASVFKTALDEVKQQRLAQIQKLQAEIAGLTSWESLANVDAGALAKLMTGTH